VSVAYPKLFSRADDLRLFAPYMSDPAEALAIDWYELRAGDRFWVSTDEPRGVMGPGVVHVKSYGDVAREYAAHPESKFAAVDGLPCVRNTRGLLHRRAATSDRAEDVGKEGNLLVRRAEGASVATERQLVYDVPAHIVDDVHVLLRERPRGKIAAAAGISDRALRDILSWRTTPRRRTAIGFSG
jgi:hypothetical protein